MNETHFGRLLLLFFNLNFWIEKKGKNVDQLISLFVATKYVLPFGQHVLMKEGFCHFNTKWPNPSFVRTCWPNGNTYLLASNKLSNAQHWRFNLKMYTKITNFQDIFFGSCELYVILYDAADFMISFGSWELNDVIHSGSQMVWTDSSVVPFGFDLVWMPGEYIDE